LGIGQNSAGQDKVLDANASPWISSHNCPGEPLFRRTLLLLCIPQVILIDLMISLRYFPHSLTVYTEYIFCSKITMLDFD
jgi:hypothetical protein